MLDFVARSLVGDHEVLNLEPSDFFLEDGEERYFGKVALALALGKNVRTKCENVANKPLYIDVHQSLTRKRGVDVFSLAKVEGGAVINDQLVVADGIFLLINGRNEVAFRLFLQRCER